MSMTSSRPYLVRALYEWIVDNEVTPHILVDAHYPETHVPQQHVNKDGHIILNISPSALRDFYMGPDSIAFNARFGGVPFDLFIPYGAVLGIYARENGQGMMFEAEPAPKSPSPSPFSPAPSPATVTDIGSGSKPRKGGLRVIK